ncbi:MAG: HEAT repeat domain-containing protein [Gemmataceae bacterium]
MLYPTLAFLLIAQPVPMNLTAPASRPAPAVAAVNNDEQILKDYHLVSSGADLLTFFRQRGTLSATVEHLAQLTKQLNDKSEAVYAKAMAELIGLGPLAAPALRQAFNYADNEEALTRARKCLQAIEGASGSAVVQSAVRMLAVRRPEGAIEELIAYLPFADDETVVQEVESALLALGMRDGKPESALLRALSDSAPIRRGIAARVLCQIGGKEGIAAVRPLLKDGRPTVRMAAALSLANKHDTEALTVLINLIAELPPEGRKRVEEYLSELAGEWTVKTPQGSDGMSGRLRRELWSAWWHALDGNQLLEEFRGRTLSDEERSRALSLIDKLGDASAAVRTKAGEELIGMGPRTASLLRQTIERQDAANSERQRRLIASAQQCLTSLEGESAKPLPEAAPRLLVLRRPRGTVEALLAYIPFVESETLAAQITDLLASVGCSDGKADPALVRALEDKVSERRAAAAVALCKGKANELAAVRKLLSDSDAVVRLRAAVALAERGDKSAVPVLIALLADLPLERVWEAEDVLTTLAGDNAPNQQAGNDKACRAASVKAWNAWWSKEEKNVDLAKLSDAERGNGLLLAIDMHAGKVLEVSRDGRVRWQLQGPQWPWDAVVSRNGNVFVVHGNTNQVSLWTRQGKELWQKSCNMPFACQQLRNGNFFVVCRQQVIEFDPNGKEVSSRQMPNLNWIVGGCQFPNGHVGLLSQQGQYVRLDTTGKEVKTFSVNCQGGVAMQAEVLPGDRVLASLNINRVAEYDDKGKMRWESNIVNPAVPHRLPNGHTLVAQNGMNHLYELDRNGKPVSEKKDLEYRPWRIRRR